MENYMDEIMLDRIACKSQRIMSSPIPQRTETPLRKLLLASRMWDVTRREQERIAELETINNNAITNDENWLVNLEDAEPLVSFVSVPIADDDDEVQETNNKDPISDATTTEIVSGDWSWLENFTATNNNTTDSLLSHTTPFDEFVSSEEESSPEDTTTEQLLLQLQEPHHVNNNNNENIDTNDNSWFNVNEQNNNNDIIISLPINNNNNNANNTNYRGCKRQREENEHDLALLEKRSKRKVKRLARSIKKTTFLRMLASPTSSNTHLTTTSSFTRPTTPPPVRV